jgi:hypothetical protein
VQRKNAILRRHPEQLRKIFNERRVIEVYCPKHQQSRNSVQLLNSYNSRLPHRRIAIKLYTMFVPSSSTFVFLAALATLGATMPHQADVSVRRSLTCSSVPVGKAVYILTNEAKNAVVALSIGHDGTLSIGTVTSTAGAGGIAIDGMTNKPGVPDALLSQSSLTVVGNVSWGLYLDPRPATDRILVLVRCERRLQLSYVSSMYKLHVRQTLTSYTYF